MKKREKISILVLRAIVDSSAACAAGEEVICMLMELTNRESDIRAHLNSPKHTSVFFANLLPEIQLPKNHLLYKEGDVPDHCYYIKKGIIVSFEYSPNGEEVIYNVNAEGSLVFESSVILEKEISVNFKTLVPSTLVKIPRDTLLQAITTNPSASFDVLCSLAEKFMGANEQMREFTNHSAYWKICNLLLTFAMKYGTGYDGKVRIDLKISQQMLANMLRVNRVTVANCIRELRDADLLEQINGSYCIRSMDALRKYMEGI